MEKIKILKKLIKNLGLDGYIIPKNDEFFSEYTSLSKDNLSYITNFSGSFGFAIILQNENYLFVDGRYTSQAKKESGRLFKILTMPGIYPSDILNKRKLNIGFDPKLHTSRSLFHYFKKTRCKLKPVNTNLVKKIRPKVKNKNSELFFPLKNYIAGEASKTKIQKIRKITKKNKIDLQFITAPENVAWLLNIRGHDSNYSPLPNGYIIISDKKVNFFCNKKKIDSNLKKFLKNVNIIDINYINIFLNKIEGKRIQIDNNSCSIAFKNILDKNNSLVETLDPVYFLKSIKNKVEINNTFKAHVDDGAALTKFLIWVKKNYKKNKITEISAQEKLLDFRKKNKSFRSLSFPTISGSGPNGSIIHYRADKKNNRILKKGDIYLIDSGGQYSFGTTDVTRTISLDNGDKKIKNIYTRVLKGHIAVASYKIKNNTSGSEIDLVARRSLKKIKLDYPHGTGHGVGYFLNVHEGPCGISKNNKTKIKEGMIISNEPGYYKENKFGIRIENLITVIKKNKSLIFENLTLAPIDKTMIEKKLLSSVEIEWLNSYHSKVFNKLKKYMNKEELFSLKAYCSNI